MKYVIVHGGGPSAVLNASLYGVVKALRQQGNAEAIYGAIGGMQAVRTAHYVDLLNVSEDELERLLVTPGTALGTSRYPIEPEDYPQLAEALHQQGISTVFLNGGNGTMDTCGKLSHVCQSYDISVIGIPKTMDNDIACVDHTPGFGSAANYVAHTVAEIVEDVRSLPIHVCVVEVMGRNAGWLAAASALAKTDTQPGPDLIYTPERPFDEETFLADVQRLWQDKKGLVVVVSEGLVNKDGKSIVPPLMTIGRATYYGDVSAYLVQLIIQRLGIKARNEKPGLAGRCDIHKRSSIDVNEAVEVGMQAAAAAKAGHTNVMVGIVRGEGSDYKVQYPLVPIEQVMMHERTMPIHFINEAGNGVTDEFIEWAKPIVQYEAPNFAQLVPR